MFNFAAIRNFWKQCISNDTFVINILERTTDVLRESHATLRSFASMRKQSHFQMWLWIVDVYSHSWAVNWCYRLYIIWLYKNRQKARTRQIKKFFLLYPIHLSWNCASYTFSKIKLIFLLIIFAYELIFESHKQWHEQRQFQINLKRFTILLDWFHDQKIWRN